MQSVSTTIVIREVAGEMQQPDSSPTLTRLVPTTGVHNFRDHGGYPLVGGGRLRMGCLYRSGEHTHATEADLCLVASLGFGAVFDLRGTAERAMAPCRWPPGFAAAIYAGDGETAVAAPHVEAAAHAMDAASARRTLSERYATVPFRPILVSVYRSYFSALASLPAPTLIFCTAGKDRTGIAVALLHTLLGVHQDDVVADYLLTNSAGDSEGRIGVLRADLQRRFGAALTEDAVRVITSVEPAYLQRAFDAITARHGNLNAYFESVLGVTPALREQLAERLIV